MMQSEENAGKILVVDDAAANRKLLHVMLRKVGYTVDECDSGQACLDYCEAELPDMILLDVMMPGIDGFETCKRLRETYTADQLPIILVTARTDGADVKHGIETGANDYITKPIDRSVLLARVKNQLSVAKSYQKIKQQQAIIAQNLALQQTIGNSLDEAILVVSDSGEVVYRNVTADRYCSGREVLTIGDIAEKLFGGALSEQIKLFARKVESDGAVNLEHEAQFFGVKRQFVLCKTYPVGDYRAGESLRIWIFRDITETRELEREINQQLKMNTVSLFAVGVAHNFNNYMGSILGASEMLAKIDPENRKQQRCVSLIQRAVQSGMRLTDKMSTLVKRDFAESEQAPQDLQAIVHDIVEHYSNREGSSVQFNLSLEKDLPRLRIEEKNINDIVGNIVSNAVDAVDGSGSVWISASFDSERNAITLKVWDDGCGMTPEVLDRLYEPFFTTKNLDTRNGMSMVGNGLGMWNVYNLINSIDGDIEVKSSPNSGTEVLITLPVGNEAVNGEERV